MDEEFKEELGKSEHGNFYVEDSIGVPHPYLITPKHIGHASDNFSGRLGEAAIRSCEEKGVTCGMKGCNLTHAEHEQAVAIMCTKNPEDDEAYAKEFQAYLLSMNPKLEESKYVGFVPVKCWE